MEQKSFTKAGQSIGITKSKISRRICDLEARLGVRLLQRSTRKLALTDIGQIFYQHCKAMVNEAQSAQEAAELVQSKPRGRIRVTVLHCLHNRRLPILLPDLCNNIRKLVLF